MSGAGSYEVVLRPKSLSLEFDVDDWLLSIKVKIGTRILQNLTVNTDGLDRYIEFAEILELPGAFVACSFYQADMNDALTRAGIFMGAGKGLKAKTLLPHCDFSLVNYKKLVAGHNLPGPVVQQFLAAAESSLDADTRANEAEQAVATAFLTLPRLKELKDAFYLIGFSIQSTKDQKAVLTHEVFHAYYFLNHAYRNVVQSFWRDVVTLEDRALITKEIALAYNVDDDDLVIDEFQAYLLQKNAEYDRVKAFVPKYRAPLMDRLSEAGIEFVKI